MAPTCNLSAACAKDLSFDDLEDFPVFYLPDDFDLDSLGFDHLGGEPSLAKSNSKATAQGRHSHGNKVATGHKLTANSESWLGELKSLAQAADKLHVGARSNLQYASNSQSDAKWWLAPIAYSVGSSLFTALAEASDNLNSEEYAMLQKATLAKSMEHTASLMKAAGHNTN